MQRLIAAESAAVLMHKQNAEHTAPVTAEQDEAMRLLSPLLGIVKHVAEEFVRQGVEPAPADKAAFAESYDHLMVVTAIVTPAQDVAPAQDDVTDTKALPRRRLPD